ncbi:MAG TPA: peptide chain release factor N(5)-glutamine methyltransferase [Tenuifilaceae bacterium]|nr:peptide chain release factor N(5)-glutamine methyltransferase [Tenuifilaceae bacterium]HPE19412.1 peptide chain release factor N(5)-glutamine methyltransferase [Tenuifilaceae bacterium]HPJ45104.1 peptide chain release factor N(5)-glutamine methyltransferase [Tenuifilaceae bacterium]HPQ35460.1 peptide chain release factor N(5)-glutamine methyltransferase [Tenuifilaceae bacterium]HRX67479.1 peptide chain release factor N(5)-glutamine methyltransferase [Tenuifilaceae bacterium]
MDIYRKLVNELETIYSRNESQSLARLIIEKVLGLQPHQILINRSINLEKNQEEQILYYLEQLKLQKPIQYLLGEAYFFNLSLSVTPDVLIPRPETEELVSWVIESASNFKNVKILDIGTGSGCIALALATNLGNSTIYATDISEKALTVARENSKLLGAEVTFLQNDILSDVSIPDSPFDIIVSNPPYVMASEKKFMKPNVLDNEPETALFVPNNDPLKYYRSIAEKAQSLLTPNGLVFCEINEAYGDETAILFSSFGFNSVEVRKDIHGKDRLLKASW